MRLPLSEFHPAETVKGSSLARISLSGFYVTVAGTAIARTIPATNIITPIIKITTGILTESPQFFCLFQIII